MVIVRGHNWLDLAQTTEPYADELIGFDPEQWLDDEDNVALTNNMGDYSLFEYNAEGVYTGHYFFAVSRGKAAVKLAREMLDEMFTIYPARAIRGIVPLMKLGSRWITRHIGFTSYGIVDVYGVGPCELFIMTKDEWRQKRENKD